MRKKDEAVLAGLAALQTVIERERGRGFPRTASNLEAVRDVAVAAWRAATPRPRRRKPAAARRPTIKEVRSA